MSTTPRQTVDTVFRTGTYPVNAFSSLRANRPDVAPLPEPSVIPQVVARPRSRRRVQYASLALPVVIAILTLLFGIAYLSAKAQETTERNRTMKLQASLKQEQNRQQLLQNERAQLESLPHIRAEAARLGMVPCNERPTLTVGQIPDPLPASSQSLPASGTPTDANATKPETATIK